MSGNIPDGGRQEKQPQASITSANLPNPTYLDISASKETYNPLTPLRSHEHNDKDALRLNSYLYAEPNVIERLTQSEEWTKYEYEERARKTVEALERGFGGNR